MIDVLIHNASGSAKTPAVLFPDTGLIRYPSGQWSSVAGVISRGGEVHEAPKKEGPKPDPVESIQNHDVSEESKIRLKIALLEEKSKRLTKAEKRELSDLKAKLEELSGGPKRQDSED